MKHDIVTYGGRVLRVKAQPVPDVTADTRRLADDMLETMYAYNGIGLAAEQIGQTLSVCVIDIPRDRLEAEADQLNATEIRLPMPLIMVNPEILERSGTESSEEGCLSFPGIYAAVTRATTLTVRFLDWKGRPQVLEARDLLARAVQHELDHLSGVLLVDRMSAVKRVSLAGTLRRLKAETEARLTAPRAS